MKALLFFSCVFFAKKGRKALEGVDSVNSYCFLRCGG